MCVCKFIVIKNSHLFAADVSEMTQNVNEMALEEISLSVPSSSAVPEELVEDFADPG